MPARSAPAERDETGNARSGAPSVHGEAHYYGRNKWPIDITEKPPRQPTAAIFSVVRDVLLQPLANDDAARLVYIRQTAFGLNGANATFSMAAIRDIKAGSTEISAFGDFSTIDFTLVGLGEPRVVKAGVVSGSYFDVVGLNPVFGRLLGPVDDGENASGALVLTHRFWTSSVNSDPSVVGKTMRLDSRSATVIGVLEPSVPYPADTEIIANIVTSPHHLGATMVNERTHRMTELFGRLAPGASVESARSELTAIHAAMMRAHPEAYPANARMQLSVTPLREQIIAPARTVLLVLLAASAIVFVIACANVANLILARSVRREGELAVRAALGAWCPACAARRRDRVPICGPILGACARGERRRYPSLDGRGAGDGRGRCSRVRPALAFERRAQRRAAGGRKLPDHAGYQPAAARIRGRADRILVRPARGRRSAPRFPGRAPDQPDRMQQPAAGARRRHPTGIRRDAEVLDFYREVTRRVGQLPGVEGVAVGGSVPWRDAGRFGPGFRFTVEGYSLADDEQHPHGRMRFVAPGFFSVLGVPLVDGRDFTGYHPIEQMGLAGRLFVHAAGDPYALAPAVTRVIRELVPDQPVERAATLEDVRTEVLGRDRLNAFVLSGFAGVLGN